MKAWLSALALTMVSVAAFGAQPSPEPGRSNSVTQPADASKQDSKPNQPAAGQPPPTVQPVQPANASKQTTDVARPNEQQARDQAVTVRNMPSLDVSRDWVDFAQIGLTLLLIVVAIWQIVLLKRTVVATEDAARAATNSSNTARDTLHLTQRADVHIDGGVRFSDDIPELLMDSGIIFTFKNGGPTRAKNIKTHGSVFIDSVEIPMHRISAPTLDIGPHSTRTFSIQPSTRWADVPTLARINQSTATFDVSIEVTYDDIFDEEHHTSMTVRFTPPDHFAITEYEAS